MHVRAQSDVNRLVDEAPVALVVFDLLRRYGLDLTDRPYGERRATLERFAADHPSVTLSPSFDDGPATEAVAREHGLEGVIAKRLNSRYRGGVRSDDWRKLRFVRNGDFVVIGWEAAAEHPATLSSLVLATREDDGRLRYAGRVGSGLAGRVSPVVKRALRERSSAPTDGVPAPVRGRKLHWVEPTAVVEVEFTAWTGDGRLRHPVFRGLRTDKRVDEADRSGADRSGADRRGADRRGDG